MIRYLLGEGFDVFLLDWGVADAVEAQNTLEDYVDDYIPEAIEATLMESGAEELDLIGYCFGGVLTLLLMAGHQDELPVRNLVTLATPADYSKMGFMSQMFASGRLDPDDVIDETGLVSARAWTRASSRSSPPTRSSSRSTSSRTSGTTSSSRASSR